MDAADIRRNLLQLLMHGLMQRDNYPSDPARVEARRLLDEYDKGKATIRYVGRMKPMPYPIEEDS